MKDQFETFLDFAVGNHGVSEIISHSLYDTVSIRGLVWSHEIPFFLEPLSADKSYSYTNMTLSAQLPKTQAFYVHDIAIGAEPYNGEIMQKAVVEFVIGSKPYFHFAPAAALYRTPEGVKYGFKLDPGLGIIGDQSFMGALRWPDGIHLPKMEFRFFLNGHLIRPTQ